MRDEKLREIALALGVSTTWTDVFGTSHSVAVPTLSSIVAALGFSVSSDEQLRDSAKRVACSELHSFHHC